ncbi:hypothetical protein [Terrimonas alba]|uniref:hypothetical protein n=1 Tax=Terrimonas alba TaxID=3349636 RepID=UPI0035F2BB66
MKYTLKLLGIACLTTFTFSCNKSGSKVEVADSLVGEWELRQTSAAMNPLAGNYSPGNGKIVKFTETRYSIYDGGQVVKQGEYRIVADPGVETSVCLVFPAGQFANRIIYDNDTTSEKQFFQITNNRLSIVAGCYAIDAGHRADYERVSTGSHN